MQAFQINVSPEIIEDLYARLGNTRWPDSLHQADWQLGTDITYLKEITDYWQNTFDWQKQQEKLNELPHFTTEIDRINIHFIHQKGTGSRPLPLLLCHGWPDSFLRFQKLIPLLTDPAANGGDPNDAFDVIIPSLPGFGFSDRPAEKKSFIAWTAGLLHKLVTETLGYASYAAHGGDVGSGVVERLGMDVHGSLVGIHLLDIPYWHLFAIQPDDLDTQEKQYLQAGQTWQFTEGGYAIEQSTKPQSLAYGLNDSPVGLAGWILEKFHRWSDCKGHLENSFTKDELLTNITLYWVTQTIRSSFTPYFDEDQTPPQTNTKISVPTGVAIFPKDIIPAPRSFAERFYNVVRWSEMPRGGHFSAWEEPELLAAELREFFRPLRTE
ncbi:MAG: epoxide hydrolase [Dyadobacter sp.]|uniref:epoxide hydrolase family protein n=1 Tax=Dyadobacter sp. TaxID=1914288 RepID=UPI001B0506B9|nr:epoxide hydrolase family protein [Dyadobacter sp.]MBO9611348.1 epoxide hydrolase [Dyadobacter sp.]